MNSLSLNSNVYFPNYVCSDQKINPCRDKNSLYCSVLPLAPKLKCKLFTKSNSTMHAFVLNLDNICTSNLSAFL